MPRSPSGASARPSPRVSIKSLELNALHTSQIQDMVHLNGNRSSLRRNTIAWCIRLRGTNLGAVRYRYWSYFLRTPVCRWMVFQHVVDPTRVRTVADKNSAV